MHTPRVWREARGARGAFPHTDDTAQATPCATSDMPCGSACMHVSSYAQASHAHIPRGAPCTHRTLAVHTHTCLRSPSRTRKCTLDHGSLHGGAASIPPHASASAPAIARALRKSGRAPYIGHRPCRRVCPVMRMRRASGHMPGSRMGAALNRRLYSAPRLCFSARDRSRPPQKWACTVHWPPPLSPRLPRHAHAARLRSHAGEQDGRGAQQKQV